MILYPFAALLFAVLMMPLCIRLARRYRLFDIPDKHRKVHHGNIPVTGGYSIILAFSLTVAGIWLIEGTGAFLSGKAGYVSMYPYIAEAAVIIVVLGVIDDLRELSYSQKFFFQFFAASLMILGAIRAHLFPEVFSLESSGVLLSSLAMVISLLWIVGTTNAINMIDGMDGLGGGTSLISSLALGVVALLWGNPVLALALFVLSGAILGFLAFNLPPARVFMGDGGSMFIGFILSISGWMLVDCGPSTLTSLAVPIIILGLPVTDTLLAFFRRIMLGSNPFSADLHHIHHMLRAKQGFSTRNTVLGLVVLSVLYGGGGIVVAVSSTTVGIIVIAGLLAGKLYFLHWLGYRELIFIRRATYQPYNVLPMNGKIAHKNGTNGHHGLNGAGSPSEVKGRQAQGKK
jgi:UDP-GlcNAc:undecaprenyl-phosphate/decaprenyl-phosphate GlcNAc-1-phosphate transferase